MAKIQAAEHRSQKVTLLDLNREGKYELGPIIDPNLHVTSVRLAARLLDPEAHVISSAMLKTHDRVVANRTLYFQSAVHPHRPTISEVIRHM